MTARACRLLIAVSVALLGAAAIGEPVARASSQPICVGVVVDFADLGGGTSTTCANVPAGSSGSDVLRATHRVTFDPQYGDDFVCAIDGKPATGCSNNDATHFWVYYHRAAGSSTWRYSSEGPATYKPADGSTEGWVYDDGSDPPPQPPAVRTACPPTASPAASGPSPSSTAPPRPARTASRLPPATAPTVAPTPPAAASPATATRSVSHGRPKHDGHQAQARQHRAVPSGPTPSGTDPPAPIATIPSASGTGIPTGALAGGALFVALAGAAAWQRHRRT